MILERQLSTKPDFNKLDKMIQAMRSLLINPDSSVLTLEELLAFQDSDGSFSLFDTYRIPSDIRVDFCHTPTYIGAAILMRALLSGREDLDSSLEQSLRASLHRGLEGYGYESEDGRIDAIWIFIKCGLLEFLETRREMCPEFHKMIHSILHEYNTAILSGNTIRGWETDYCKQWQDILDELATTTRFYIAYGSNMSREQMLRHRCPHATFICTTYIEDWELTMPFYANIEPSKGARTPAVLWEINAYDESALDNYEGYPEHYDKTDIIVVKNECRVSAMAYVMTDEYKNVSKKPRSGYEEGIVSSYKALGFLESEYMPRRGILQTQRALD